MQLINALLFAGLTVAGSEAVGKSNPKPSQVHVKPAGPLAASSAPVPQPTGNNHCTTDKQFDAYLRELQQLSGNADQIILGVQTSPDAKKGGPELVSMFGNIGRTMTNDITAVGMKPICMESEKNQKQMCKSYHEFTQVYSSLLQDIIGKHKAFSTIHFEDPLAAAFRGNLAQLDMIGDLVIQNAPHCAQAAVDDKNNLDSTIKHAINSFGA